VRTLVNMSRHVRNHSYCGKCNTWTTKKRHHVHREEIDTSPESTGIQIWIPLIIPIAAVRRLWPGYTITDVMPPPIPTCGDSAPPNIENLLAANDSESPSNIEDLFRTYFPEFTADSTLEGFVEELKEAIKDSADKNESFEQNYYNDMKYWDYNVEYLKNLVVPHYE
jgi:hypothetical protein